MTPTANMASSVVGCAPVQAPQVPVSGLAVLVSEACLTHAAEAPIVSAHALPAAGRWEAQIHSHELGAVAPGVTVGAVSDELVASLA